MKRRDFLKMISLGAAMTLPRFASAVRRPNVLFIASDDMNDWIGCMGGHQQARTPNIDRLARTGMLFTNAHCAAPVCGPSRAAIFTGRYPFNTGIYVNGDKFDPADSELVTLPEHFAKQGYETFGAGKLLHGGTSTNTAAFDEYGPGYNKWTPLTSEETKITAEELADNEPYVRHVVDRGPGKLKAVLPLNKMPRDRNRGSSTIESFDWGPFDVEDDEMSDAEIARWAIEKLEQAHDKPFFLGVGFYRPHQPLFAPRKYHDMYPPGSVKLPETPADDLDDLSKTGKDFGRRALTSGLHETVLKYGQWENAVSSYLACISFVDAQIGRVIEALEESPYAGNTIIVFWTDHGWQLGEKEHWGKFTGWERSTRTPLIIKPAASAKPKGFKPGQPCQKGVNLIDMYPTLVDLCALESADHLDGRSLAPLLANPDAKWDRPVITTFGRGNHSIKAGNWRYIHYYDGSEELYDHRNDPNEWKNLAKDPEHKNMLKRMNKMLPKNESVLHFVRMGKWKALIHKNDKNSELFDLEAGNWVDDKKNIAKDNPEILKKIRDYLSKNNITKQYLVIPGE